MGSCYKLFNVVLLALLLTYSPPMLLAQASTADPFVGSWQAKMPMVGNGDSAVVELLVGTPQRNSWYPIRMSIQWDTLYQAAYATIARKDTRVFAWNPQAISFLGKPSPWQGLFQGLAGYWDLTRKSPSEASFTRLSGSLPSNQPKIDDKSISLELVLRQAIQRISSFKQLDRQPWQSPVQEQLLAPHPLGQYLGLRDTLQVNQRDAEVVLQARQSGLASLVWNGRLLADDVPLGKKVQVREDWVLDTSANIVLLFREPAIWPTLQGQLGKSRWTQYFDPKQDSGALFVVTKLQVGEDGFHQRRFPASARVWDGMKKDSPGEKVLANLEASTEKITLAIWDDAEQDGDTVSIRVNNRIVADRILVKRAPQFISVNLEPKGNVITITAENLGSIPPNTSILEIIDGQRRKAFHLDNLIGELNHLNVYLGAHPPR